MKDKLPKEIQLILNGHNEEVKKAERLLIDLLMKMVYETRGKEGEELAGMLNFWLMEFRTILRKAAAIGYAEADHNLKIKHDNR